MAFYRLTKGKAEQIRALLLPPGGTEKSVQSLIEENLESIFGVRFVATEFATGAKHRGRIDTLGLDQDGSPVILEYKRSSSDNIINQGLFYLDWLMDHRGDFEVKARSVFGDAEVSWASPRLMLVASSFSRYDQYAVNRIDDRIELWIFKFYEGDLFHIEPLREEEQQHAKVASASTSGARTAKKKVAMKPPGYDLSHHEPKMSPETLRLFNELRERIMSLGDDVSERFMNQYVGYRRLRNFTEIVGQRKKLNVFLDGPVSDPAHISEDVKGVGHWGTGDQRVSVSSDADVERVLPLIRQAYDLQQ